MSETCEHCGQPIVAVLVNVQALRAVWVHSRTCQMSCGAFYSTHARPARTEAATP